MSANAEETRPKFANLIYERGCQEKHLPDGLQPRHSIVVEAASPICPLREKPSSDSRTGSATP